MSYHDILKLKYIKIGIIKYNLIPEIVIIYPENSITFI